MPEKKPVDSLQELVTEIGKEGQDKDGALHVLAKGMNSTLVMLTGLVTALMPLSNMEKAAQLEIKPVAGEAGAKTDPDPGTNDKANEPTGTDVDARAGYDDLQKGKNLPEVGTLEGGDLDVTGFLRALWGKMAALEKGQRDLVSLVMSQGAQSTARDVLVGEAIQSGISTLAMGMVQTHEALLKIPATPGVSEAAIAAIARGTGSSPSGQRTGGRAPMHKGKPVAVDSIEAQTGSGLTPSMMMMGMNRNIIEEGQVRLWRKTGRLDPDDTKNADLVARLKNATEASA